MVYYIYTAYERNNPKWKKIHKIGLYRRSEAKKFMLSKPRPYKYSHLDWSSIPDKTRFWTDAENKFIKEQYEDKTNSEIAKILRRSRQAVTFRNWYLGLKGKIYKTKEQILKLLQNSPLTMLQISKILNKHKTTILYHMQDLEKDQRIKSCGKACHGAILWKLTNA